ncbi:IS30 family transposase [Paenibacillus sp. RC254]
MKLNVLMKLTSSAVGLPYLSGKWTPEQAAVIEKKLQATWSPEQIVERLRQEGQRIVCFKTISLAVYESLGEGRVNGPSAQRQKTEAC